MLLQAEPGRKNNTAGSRTQSTGDLGIVGVGKAGVVEAGRAANGGANCGIGAIAGQNTREVHACRWDVIETGLYFKRWKLAAVGDSSPCKYTFNA